MSKGDRLKLKTDPEDGTIPIANLLLEAVAMAKLSGLEIGAILYLWKRTYEQKVSANITLTEWCRALDRGKSQVSKALTHLHNMNIITREQNIHWHEYTYSFNDDINTWHKSCLNPSLIHNNNRCCKRCDRQTTLESHHIIPKTEGGGDNEDNKEFLCSACHDYTHAKRNLLQSLARAKKQTKRESVYQNRLKCLEEINTIPLIQHRGYYLSWWEHNNNLHFLPPYERINKTPTQQLSLVPRDSLEGVANG